ncbi:MAG: 50S ribosomal protein L30 [Promethearchaeota archaeon]
MFAIRIRGLVKMRRDINDTLNMLRLNRVNMGVLLKVTPSVKGMLQKCKDYIAWGPLDEKILVRLLYKRGRVTGNKPLTDEYLREESNEFPDIKKLGTALSAGKTQLRDIKGVKPVFRLHPPRGGHRGGIKRDFNSGGTLGFVGSYINKLLLKMM